MRHQELLCSASVLGAAIVALDNCRHPLNMRPESVLFQPGNPATIKLSHCPEDGRLLDLSESPLRVLYAGCHGPVDRRQRTGGPAPCSVKPFWAPREAFRNTGGLMPAQPRRAQPRLSPWTIATVTGSGAP
jgi:hypothetical protein